MPGTSERDVTDETTTPGEPRVSGPRVIYRWPERRALPAPPCVLAPLLDDVQRYIHRYVVLSTPQAIATTLWVAHCHAFAVAEATPYLNVTSAVKQSGKTRLLEVLEPLVPAAWLTGRVSAAVLTRKVDGETPTLLLDESDAAFKHDSEYSEALRSILNSGYRRSGISSLCVGQGTSIGYRDFSTFCPKAIAGIGALPDTVTDRSIRIALKRRMPDESCGTVSAAGRAPGREAARCAAACVEGRGDRGATRRRASAAECALRPGRRCVGTAHRHCRSRRRRLAHAGASRRHGPVRGRGGGR